jgi:hypothetical protein
LLSVLVSVSISPHYNPADYLIDVLFTYGDVPVATQVGIEGDDDDDDDDDDETPV